MSDRQWLDAVKQELVHRRLPRQEVARLLAELSDHLDDVRRCEIRPVVGPAAGARGDLSPLVLTEEPMSVSAPVAESLGSPAEIADSALREFRRRNLLSRSRLAAFAMFVLAPIPLMVVVWGLLMCLLGLIAELIPDSVIQDEPYRLITEAQVIGVNAFVLALVICPPIAVAAFYGRLARRTVHRWQWGIVACVLVGIASSLLTYHCTFAEEPGKSQIQIGLGVGASLRWPRFSEIGQFVVPLASGLIVLRRSVAQRA